MSSFFAAKKPLHQFSIDDAFDIPEEEDEDEEEEDGHDANGHALDSAPIIRNGVQFARYTEVRHPDLEARWSADKTANAPENGGHGGTTLLTGHHHADTGSLVASAASNSGGGRDGGYYEGRNCAYKYWWLHPKVRANWKVVLAAATLLVLGLGLVIAGMVAYCIESLAGVQGAVFIIAGLICFIPGAYHLGYVYLAVKGKRGFDFNQLPLFNN